MHTSAGQPGALGANGVQALMRVLGGVNLALHSTPLRAPFEVGSSDPVPAARRQVLDGAPTSAVSWNDPNLVPPPLPLRQPGRSVFSVLSALCTSDFLFIRENEMRDGENSADWGISRQDAFLGPASF